MSPRKPPEPEQPPPPPGRGSIPPDVAARLEQRAGAFARGTSRPRGKPWDGVTYGKSAAPTDKERAARKRAIAKWEADHAEDQAQD